MSIPCASDLPPLMMLYIARHSQYGAKVARMRFLWMWAFYSRRSEQLARCRIESDSSRHIRASIISASRKHISCYLHRTRMPLSTMHMPSASKSKRRAPNSWNNIMVCVVVLCLQYKQTSCALARKRYPYPCIWNKRNTFGHARRKINSFSAG